MHDQIISLKPTAFDILRYGFFDIAFGNILRGIRGGMNPIGSLTLAMRFVSASSQLEWALNNRFQLETNGEIKKLSRNESHRLGYVDNKLFKNWLDRWVRDSGINLHCDSLRTYGLRCGLVHTAGGSSALSDTGVKAWNISADDPDVHYQVQESEFYDNNGKLYLTKRFCLHLPSFLAELMLAFDKFANFYKNDLENADAPLTAHVNQIALFNGNNQKLVDSNALAWFDERLVATPLSISAQDLADKIESFYYKAVKAGLVLLI